MQIIPLFLRESRNSHCPVQVRNNSKMKSTNRELKPFNSLISHDKSGSHIAYETF